mgnify:CR=1 FL=1|nr:MAG TPA: Repressor protein CI [Caudoviricetes sp.]
MAKYEDHLADADLKRQIIDDFSTALNYYMRRDGVRQQDLMNDLNLSSATVSTWVNGKRMPKPEAIKKLARYFHVSEGDMSRLPAWIDFAEVSNADVEEDLYNLMHVLDAVKSISVGRVELPQYIVQNTVSAIKVALEYAKEKNNQ